MELQSRYDDLKKRGMGLVAISHDPREILARFAASRQIAFPLLADAGSATIRQYGILNTDLKEGDPNYGIPFPGTFVLDARGVVVSKAFEERYQERSTVSSLLVKVDGQALAPATKITSERLDVTVTASDEELAPGNRMSLILDFVPKRNVHVYAPTVENYRPLSVSVNTQDGLLKVHPIDYPASEEYHFKPLDERVQVYQKPFRVVQDLTLEATPDAQKRLAGRDSLTISGQIDYQACDDKMCFNPVTVPLSWTVKLRPLIRERP